MARDLIRRAGRTLPAATDLGAYARGIPLELFVARWGESALGAEIRCDAPALFTRDASRPACGRCQLPPIALPPLATGSDMVKAAQDGLDCLVFGMCRGAVF